ncbi:ribonuclease E/G [Roseburia hominis]
METGRKLVICECKDRQLAALFEDGKAVELHYASQSACRVGEIYVGKIQKILPNISAAFVEIGKGVLCYYSLSEKYEPVFTSKAGKKPFCVGDELLVQVQKEAVKTKQPVVTGNLNFTGKYVVLTSGNRTIGVSAKLSPARRAELEKLGIEYADEAFGIIFRTNAKAASDELIRSEIRKLSQSMQNVLTYGRMRTCFSLVRGAASPCIAVLRDIYQEGLSEIVVEKQEGSDQLYQEVQTYLQEEQPEDLGKLRAYTDASYPLAKCYNLERITDEALKERVWLNSGAYLVIEPTEALTVIDVNSGKCQKKKAYFPQINQEAARECARQIRLRNLSGIILIDFINLNSEEEQKELLHYLRQELSRDPNPGNVVDMTALQLVEITRKKVYKTLKESLYG